MSPKIFQSQVLTNLKKALANEDSFATTIRVAVESIYGPDVFGNPAMGVEAADPVLIWRAVYDDLGISMPEQSENRINALITALSYQGFYYDPEAFTAVCNALYSGEIGDVISAGLDELTVPEITWGMYEVDLNRGQPGEYSPAVQKVIAETVQDENMEQQEGLVEPFYVDVFMSETIEDLKFQLNSLGLEWQEIDYLKSLK